MSVSHLGIIVEQSVRPAREAVEVAKGYWLVPGAAGDRLATTAGRITSDAGRRRVPSAPDHPATREGRTIIPTTPAGSPPLELLPDGTLRHVDDEGRAIGESSPILEPKPVDGSLERG